MRTPPADRSSFLPGAVHYLDVIEDIHKMIDKAYERDPLLVERQKTHGNFSINARLSQEIKSIMHGTCGISTGFSTFNVVHQEALEMIALKLSRILSGQANFKDHWDDIAGYAKLGSEACE